MKKNELKIIENVKLDDIKTFTKADDAVVMVLKDGQEVRFELMKNACDRFDFYDMIDRIKVTEQENPHTNYLSVDGFLLCGNYHLKLNDVSKTCGNEDPAVVYSQMLEAKAGAVHA